MSFLGRVTQNLQSIINYVSNGSADNSISGWSTYADAAGAQPVDGTGGTPSITLSRSVTTPLRQGSDFNLVKDAANRQGQGVSYDFTIDRADLAKVLTVTFDYEVLSGTYATGDLTVYLIQDPTGTPVVIQPAGYQVQSSTVGTTVKQIATFQTSSSVRNYRLCLHVASTSASAYSLAFDRVTIGPQTVQYGAPVTDWQAYTPTFTGFGTATNVEFYWRRVGGNLEVKGKFTSGTVTAVEGRISLPAGLTSVPLTQGIVVAGVMVSGYFSTTRFALYTLIESAQTYMTFGAQDAASSAITKALANQILSTSPVTLTFECPIQGWSSSVQMSNDTDTRVVAARYVANATQVLPANTTTKLVLGSRVFDTTASFDTVNNEFVCPVPGFYRISSMVAYIGVPAGATILATAAYRNGVAISDLAGDQATTVGAQHRLNGTITIQCSAGDRLSVWAFSGGAAFTINQSSIFSYTEFERLSGPSAIAASETVAARYTNTAGTSVPTGGAGAGLVPVPFANRSYDSHGFFNGSTGVGTIPISGTYRISCSFYFQAQAWTAIGKAVAVRKNGVLSGYLAIYTPASASTIDLGLVGTTEVRFNAGDTFDLNLWHNEASARTLSTLVEANSITISRIGN